MAELEEQRHRLEEEARKRQQEEEAWQVWLCPHIPKSIVTSLHSMSLVLDMSLGGSSRAVAGRVPHFTHTRSILARVL